MHGLYDDSRPSTYLDRFPSQDKKCFRPLRQEARKLMDQDILNLVRLLDLDRHSDTIYTGLYEDLFILVPGYGQRIEKQFGGRCGFYLRDVVSFSGL